MARGGTGCKKQGLETLSTQHTVTVHIARPYATALFELAAELNSVAEIEKSLDAFSAIVGESPDFARFLRSPVITSEEKSKAMEVILEKAKPHKEVANFVDVVARHGRLFALPVMISEFKKLASAARGEVVAEVTSAAALSKAQLKSLSDTLKQKIGKTVKLNTSVDPELIGGLVVKVGSQMIDSSLRTKLTAMKIAMKEVG